MNLPPDAMQIITSRHNPRVKEVIKLRDRSHRDKQRRMLIDGVRELARALDTGIRPVEAFVCEPMCTSPPAREVLDRLRREKVEIVEVAPAVFAKLAYGEREEGIVAAAEIPHTSLADLTLPANPLLAVLEGIEKPGNLGAVLRCADGAGISAVIAADGGTDLYNPNVIRASLGTIFTVPTVTAPTAKVVPWLKARKIRIYTARVDGAILYTRADFSGPAAIVLGSESSGLSASWKGEEVAAIRLPMRGSADSLNVSAAAAALFYEALRQRS